MINLIQCLLLSVVFVFLALIDLAQDFKNQCIFFLIYIVFVVTQVYIYTGSIFNLKNTQQYYSTIVDEYNGEVINGDSLSEDVADDVVGGSAKKQKNSNGQAKPQMKQKIQN